MAEKLNEKPHQLQQAEVQIVLKVAEAGLLARHGYINIFRNSSLASCMAFGILRFWRDLAPKDTSVILTSIQIVERLAAWRIMDES
jgi:hypothetical protein